MRTGVMLATAVEPAVLRGSPLQCALLESAKRAIAALCCCRARCTRLSAQLHGVYTGEVDLESSSRVRQGARGARGQGRRKVRSTRTEEPSCIPYPSALSTLLGD